MNGFPNQSNYCLQGKLLCYLIFDGVQRLATSTYKPVRLGKSLLLGLSRRSGQTYPLVADRVASHPCLICVRRLTSLIIGVQQLDIVKFALPLEKISFHPIFSAVGKHTNFFMSDQLFHVLKKSPYAISA